MQPDENAKYVRFVSVSAVAGDEEGSEVIFAVDKVGAVFRGEVSKGSTTPTWTRITRPEIPPELRRSLRD